MPIFVAPPAVMNAAIPRYWLETLGSVPGSGLALDRIPPLDEAESFRDQQLPWLGMMAARGHESVPRVNLAAGDADYRKRSVREVTTWLRKCAEAGAYGLSLPSPQALEETSLPGISGVPVLQERARDQLWRSLDELGSLQEEVTLQLRIGLDPGATQAPSIAPDTWDAWMDHLRIPHLGLAILFTRPPVKPEQVQAPGNWVRLVTFGRFRWDEDAHERWEAALEASPSWSRPDWCLLEAGRDPVNLTGALAKLRARHGA